jgi:hypothetical protein
LTPQITSLLVALAGYMALAAARRAFNWQIKPPAIAFIMMTSTLLCIAGCVFLLFIAPRDWLGFAFTMMVVTFYWRALVP